MSSPVRLFPLWLIPLVAIAGCADSPVATQSDLTPQFAKTSYNLKFAWTGQELDGDGSSNDVIEAHVRRTGGGAQTTCVYFSDDRSVEIGRYYAETWSSQSESEVLAFCLSHFSEAVTGGGQRFNYQAYFDDVALDATTIGDIQAHSKQSNHGPYSDCVFYSQDGATYLGNYGGSVAFALKSDLRDWCIANFANRTDQ